MGYIISDSAVLSQIQTAIDNRDWQEGYQQYPNVDNVSV